MHEEKTHYLKNLVQFEQKHVVNGKSCDRHKGGAGGRHGAGHTLRATHLPKAPPAGGISPGAIDARIQPAQVTPYGSKNSDQVNLIVALKVHYFRKSVQVEQKHLKFTKGEGANVYSNRRHNIVDSHGYNFSADGTRTCKINFVQENTSVNGTRTGSVVNKKASPLLPP